jgi:hypothetical protein
MHRALDRLGDGIADDTDPSRGLGHASGDDRLGIGPGEGRFPRQHLVEDRAQAVDVRPRADPPFASPLLGAHVHGRTEYEPSLRQAFSTRRIEGVGDAEVGHHRLAGLEEDVLRLDVAVDDPVAVGVGEGREDVAGDLERVLQREQLLASEPVPQRLALHVGHGVPELAGRFAGVMDREDVRMLQARGESDLAQKALGAQHGG